METVKHITETEVWEALGNIHDPEIPVLSLVEMKIIRSVSIAENTVTVVMTPTFVGCPALDQMREEISSTLTRMGFEKVDIRLTFSPPWSTDMLEEHTLEKLRVYGIAPPPKLGEKFQESLDIPVACPFCGSRQTHVKGLFGSTLCKQMVVCDSCKQPFERFKPI